MATKIDAMFGFLDWNKSREEQKQGLAWARQIENLSILIQPIESKSLWHNCAVVIIEKNDHQLEPYLMQLFEWLKDLNWPGADLIYERRLTIPVSMLKTPFDICLKQAVKINDCAWESVLIDFWKEYKKQ